MGLEQVNIKFHYAIFQFSTKLNSEIFSIVLKSNGKILSGGRITYINSNKGGLIELNVDGSKNFTGSYLNFHCYSFQIFFNHNLCLFHHYFKRIWFTHQFPQILWQYLPPKSIFVNTPTTL